jgi:hypothetical protein
MTPEERKQLFVGLRAALDSKDKDGICRLKQSIPANCWQYGPGRAAVLWQDSVASIAALAGNINTYKKVCVNIMWLDGRPDFLGEYAAEELRLPNYIPPSERLWNS